MMMGGLPIPNSPADPRLDPMATGMVKGLVGCCKGRQGLAATWGKFRGKGAFEWKFGKDGRDPRAQMGTEGKKGFI